MSAIMILYVINMLLGGIAAIMVVGAAIYMSNHPEHPSYSDIMTVVDKILKHNNTIAQMLAMLVFLHLWLPLGIYAFFLAKPRKFNDV
jgi:hypothetical protein